MGAHTGAIDHLSPIWTEQSILSSIKESLCVDIMVFTLRFNVLSNFRPKGIALIFIQSM
jgi:hypothetical protein